MRHNFSVEGVAVVDEVIVRAHSTPDRIGHDLIKAGGFEVWTGPGKTGTALVVGTDFDLSVKDTKRTARAEFDIYTLFAVINATYLNTTLYLTYTSCGDYLSIENVSDAVCENITLAGTNGAVPLDAMVTGERRRYFKTGAYHASGYVFTATGATFEGRASISLYGQYSFVEIERISATLFAVRDLKDLPVYVRAGAYPSVGTGLLLFDAISSDAYGCIDASSGHTRVIAPKKGIYHVSCKMQLSNGGSNAVILSIFKNTSTLVDGIQNDTSANRTFQIEGDVFLEVGDFIAISITMGTSATVSSDPNYSNLQVTLVSEQK